MTVASGFTLQLVHYLYIKFTKLTPALYEYETEDGVAIVYSVNYLIFQYR
jgi:hypothetical protein